MSRCETIVDLSTRMSIQSANEGQSMALEESRSDRRTELSHIGGEEIRGYERVERRRDPAHYYLMLLLAHPRNHRNSKSISVCSKSHFSTTLLLLTGESKQSCECDHCCISNVQVRTRLARYQLQNGCKPNSCGANCARQT